MIDLIAIDPGTEASGVAFFQNEKLVDLKKMNLPELTALIAEHNVQYVVEDVEAIKTIYNRNRRSNPRTGLQVAQSVGLVKATGRHIIRFMEWHGRTVELIPPTPGNWGTADADIGKKLLAQRLGWTGSSNKDGRSAAFFGWLYITRSKQRARTAKALA